MSLNIYHLQRIYESQNHYISRNCTVWHNKFENKFLVGKILRVEPFRDGVTVWRLDRRDTRVAKIFLFETARWAIWEEKLTTELSSAKLLSLSRRVTISEEKCEIGCQSPNDNVYEVTLACNTADTCTHTYSHIHMHIYAHIQTNSSQA